MPYALVDSSPPGRVFLLNSGMAASLKLLDFTMMPKKQTRNWERKEPLIELEPNSYWGRH